MDMSGERLLNAPRDRVWAALNDAEALRTAIPGCEMLEKVSDTGFTATVITKVGPIKAKFTGSVTLSEITPPTGYTISGEGQGGLAGFAKGGAVVRLEEVSAGETRLVYDVKANVGGKLAQLGARLIDSTARKLAEQFFDRFSAGVSGAEAIPPAVEDDDGAAGLAHSA